MDSSKAIQESILSKCQCGFRKVYVDHRCLETWKEATDNNKAFGALLTDLSKAFDCLTHDLLIAKIHTHVLDLVSLNIVQDWQIENKEQKWTQYLVLGKRYDEVYHKVIY